MGNRASSEAPSSAPARGQGSEAGGGSGGVGGASGDVGAATAAAQGDAAGGASPLDMVAFNEDGGATGSGESPLEVTAQEIEAKESLPGYWPNARDPAAASGGAMRAERLFRGSQCYGPHGGYDSHGGSDKHLAPLGIRTIIDLRKTKKTKVPVAHPVPVEPQVSRQAPMAPGRRVASGDRVTDADGAAAVGGEGDDEQRQAAAAASAARDMAGSGQSRSNHGFFSAFSSFGSVMFKKEDHSGFALGYDPPTVVSVDLIPTGVSLAIIRKFPWWNIGYVIIFSWFCGGGPEQAVFESFPDQRMRICSSLIGIIIGIVIGAVIAVLLRPVLNVTTSVSVIVPVILFFVVIIVVAMLTYFCLEHFGAFTKWEGWETLYITIMDHSKKNIAKVFRVLADPDAYPVMVHCIHGKDRTGLVCALAMIMAGATDEQACDDYAWTEVLMMRAKSRGGDELSSITAPGGTREFMIGDEVLASPRKAMAATLRHMRKWWKTPDEYLKVCGLTAAEVASVRANLAAPADERPPSPPGAVPTPLVEGPATAAPAAPGEAPAPAPAP